MDESLDNNGAERKIVEIDGKIYAILNENDMFCNGDYFIRRRLISDDLTSIDDLTSYVLFEVSGYPFQHILLTNSFKDFTFLRLCGDKYISHQDYDVLTDRNIELNL